jgi:hypothetical protein
MQEAEFSPIARVMAVLLSVVNDLVFVVSQGKKRHALQRLQLPRERMT